MKSLDDFKSWFRAEAGTLPIDARRGVLAAVESNEPRQVFLGLNRWWEAGQLTTSWGPVLEDLYFMLCY